MASGFDHLRAELSRGRNLTRAHRHAEAVSVLVDVVAELSDAAEATSTDHVEARVTALCTLVASMFEVDGDLQRCLSLLDEAETLVHEHDLAHLEVQVRQVQGYCFMRSGDLEAALDRYAMPDELLAVADREDRCRVLLNRGVAQLTVGSLQEAGHDLERARKIAMEVGHAELAMKGAHNLGYLAHLRGDLPTALQLMGAPLDMPDPDGLGARLRGDPLVQLDRARALVEAGLFDEAADLLDTAIATCADTSRPLDEGEARITRARLALLVDDFAVAADQARAAQAAFRAQRNRWWRRHARLVELAAEVELHQAGSRHDPVLREPRSIDDLAVALEDVAAEAVRDQDGSSETMARLMQAEVALVVGNTPRAAELVPGAQPHPADGVSSWLRWCRVRAEVALGRGGTDLDQIVAEGLDRLAEHQARLGSLDLRTAMAVHGGELADIGIEAALASGESERLYSAVERARAVSSRLPPVRADVPGEVEDGLAELRRVLRAVDELQAAGQVDRALLARRRDEAAALMKQVRVLQWETQGSDAHALRVASLSAVQARLDDVGAVAVTMFRRRSVLHAIVVVGDDLVQVPVAEYGRVRSLVAAVRADLEALLMAGVAPSVRRVMNRSLQSGLRDLADVVVEPLGLDDCNLVVAPTAELALLPWNLLPGCRDRAVTVVPSLTAWVNAMARPPSDGGFTAVAGPDLDRAVDEVRAVAAAWPRGTMQVLETGSVAQVCDALATRDLVHLAAHGTHRASSPLFSSVGLEDGPLFAHELERNPATLVVLSACQVGSATLRPGDEPLGFSAALLHAGVGTVVAGMTSVRDDVAHDVMVHLHAELAGGASPAAALSSAVATVGDRGHPAPFTCLGAGFVGLRGRS